MSKKIVAETAGIEAQFDFVLRWEMNNEEKIYAVNLAVYEIIALDTNGVASYHNKQSTASDQWVTDLDKAEVYLAAYIKWDGCSTVTMGDVHLCGVDSWVRHTKLMKRIYARAMEIMGRQHEPEHKWEE